MLTIGNQNAVIGSTLKARSGALFVLKSIEQLYIIATDESGKEVVLRFKDIMKFSVIRK